MKPQSNDQGKSILDLVQSHTPISRRKSPTLSYLHDSVSTLYDLPLKEYTSLDWVEVENESRFILPLKEESQFGCITIDRKRISQRQKSPEYTWKSGYSFHHTLPDKYTESQSSGPRYSYTSKLLQRSKSSTWETFDQFDVTTIGISESLDSVTRLSEEYLLEEYPECYSSLRTDADWKKQPWKENDKLRGLSIPLWLMVDPCNPLSNGIVNFYSNNVKVKNLLVKGISPLDEELTKKYPQLRLHEESKLEWAVLNRSSKCLVLPCSIPKLSYIEIKEYLPCQYQVLQKGFSERLISVQASSKHLKPDQSVDGAANLMVAFREAELYISQNYPHLLNLKKVSSDSPSPWKLQPATEKQMTMLTQRGITISEETTKGEAALRITETSF